MKNSRFNLNPKSEHWFDDIQLFGAINHLPNFQPMPRNAPKLSDCKIDQIQIWIENGTPNN